MKKKLALILLAGTLVLSCTGCGVMTAFTEAFFAELANSDQEDEDEDEDKESKESEESESTEKSESTKEAESTKETESTEESKSTEVVESSATESTAEIVESTDATGGALETELPTYTFGTFTETGYESEFLNLSFTTPEGCKLSDVEELLLLSNVKENLAGEQMLPVIEIMSTHIPLVQINAEFEETLSSLIMVLEPTEEEPRNVEDAMNDLVKQLTAGTERSFEVGEMDKVEVAGTEYLRVPIYYGSGSTVVVQEVYGAYINNKFVHMTIYYAQVFEKDRDAFLDAFAILNE